MTEVVATEVAVGDQIRVHFHPAGPWKSFSEGVVRRVDVTTPEGRFFVLEVRNEVILDQPHRIIPSPNEDDSSQFQSTGDVIQHGKRGGLLCRHRWRSDLITMPLT